MPLFRLTAPGPPGGLFDYAGLPGDNIWATGGPMAPFDTNFYLIISAQSGETYLTFCISMRTPSASITWQWRQIAKNCKRVFNRCFALICIFRRLAILWLLLTPRPLGEGLKSEEVRVLWGQRLLVPVLETAIQHWLHQSVPTRNTLIT